MTKVKAAALVVAALLTATPVSAQDLPVDLELVLAVDVSQSVDFREGRLQRQGYVKALSDQRVIDAIQRGGYGRIAVTYVEWAGPGLWRKTIGWQLIDGGDSARSFADALAEVPIARGTGTSITSILAFAVDMYDGNGFEGVRRVIDISGDGPNSSGGNVTLARDALIATGVTVNGLAINNFDGSAFTLPDLDVYYHECVIGGPGAFVIAAEGFETFADAILRKLILEIAGAPPLLQLAGDPWPAADRLLIQSPGTTKYAPACDIGERMRYYDSRGFMPRDFPMPIEPPR
jgi:hypothetical protein